ncbi:hypothetical protein Cme02nite_42230 [Catellatospora methionotrophica]|uniref:DUF4352 domain-containing protein n=1 Tax=Catellatospora methionotrophica TaxID=121620 RepID=A0A8J3LIQ4_9ACTN|nr:hypothetical protein [Catellatospora methionotrophica]GIG15891.1 hypothetical protein Cme02nite_42230 [Catellatospora methionotrophica]
MKLLRRLGYAAFVLAALAAGQAIQSAEPNFNHNLRPFPVAGEVGTEVAARTFTAQVQLVRCAAALRIGDTILDTQGVWIVAKLRVGARFKPTSIAYAAARDGAGRVYQTTDRVTLNLVTGGHVMQPGLPYEGEIAIEVPTAAAGSLTLLLADNSIDQRMDSMAEIRLPISDGAACSAEPTTLLAPKALS